MFLVPFSRSRSWCFCSLVLAITHVPVVEEHLIKERFLLVFSQQATLQRVIEVLFVGDIDVIQRLGEVQHLARSYIDSYFPQDAPELCQAVEQALAALDFVWLECRSRLSRVITVDRWLRSHITRPPAPFSGICPCRSRQSSGYRPGT